MESGPKMGFVIPWLCVAQQLSVSARVSRSTNFGTMTSAKNFTVYFDGQEEDLFQTYFGNLSLKFTPCKNLELQLLSSSYYTQEHETYDISGEYWLSDVDGSSTLSVDYGMGIGTYHQHARNRLNATVSNLSQIGRYVLSNNELKWGLTYQREHVSEHTNEWELRDSAGYSIPSGQDAYALYYNLFSHNVLSANRLLAYLQDSYNFILQWAEDADSGAAWQLLGL